LAKGRKVMLRNHLINITQDPKSTGVRVDNILPLPKILITNRGVRYDRWGYFFKL
jgi:hypothetical protein